MATLLNNLAWAYQALGDPRRALGTYENALEIRREVGDRAGEGTTMNNIGLVSSSRLGDRQRALQSFERALRIFQEGTKSAGWKEQR